MFDQTTRNRLQKFVGEARALLADEFTRQFRQDYGLDPASGEVSPLESLRQLDAAGLETARLLRDTLEHYRAGSPGGNPRELLQRIVREQAFTVLNRLCALRMAEARGILLESVGQGYQSKGFQLYARLAGTALGDTGGAYRGYLFSLFDEFAVDLAVLFDRFAPTGRLFPRESALLELLARINHPDLETLWAQDETIGWIYQYFNSQEERRQMRAESQAPRNSRELAVRNQFFTPRYVVEFLTDNTLGRIWYEMTKGETGLVGSCRYLVRRPGEVFLERGQPLAENLDIGHSLLDIGNSEKKIPNVQQGMSNVQIPHRPLKDPRTIRMLDPACGSMHFGLYAFDLYERIYGEAWALEETHALERPDELQPLRATYAGDYDAFRRDVPRLILEYNIHGVDIDPRAAQIAGLSLWLRAQRSWQEQGLPAAERPRIERSNVVCAEPMPGEKDLLREFSAGLHPPVLGQLVEQIFEKMELAGEAGSLLKIEEEIAGAVDKARQAFEKELKVGRQGALFAEAEQARFDFSGLGRRTHFWDQAEQRILDALQAYAEQAEGNTRRRLFARDAARGFAFIDLCRKRYDVVLMNPPFGEGSNVCDEYFRAYYPDTSGDLYSMFFDRALHLSNERGKAGAITNRTWLSLPSFEGLRTRIFGKLGCVETAADLGSFVLDAQVETATVVISRDFPEDRFAFWVRLLKTKSKNQGLLSAINSVAYGNATKSVFWASQRQFKTLPSCVYGYWMSADLISLYRADNSINARAAEVKQGTATADDYRFLRLIWEVPLKNLGLHNDWVYFAKGGEYQNFYDDVHLAILWNNEGKEIIAWGNGRPQNTNYFGRPGITWPRRTTSPFGPRVLPSGCAFGDKGPAAFPNPDINTYRLLGLLTSNPTKLLLSVRLGAGDDAPGSASKSYEVGLIRDLPFPDFGFAGQNLEELTSHCTALMRLLSVEDDETTSYFIRPVLLNSALTNSIRDAVQEIIEVREDCFVELAHNTAAIDKIVGQAFKFSDTDYEVMREEIESPIATFVESNNPDPEIFQLAYLTKEAIPGELLPGGIEAETDVRIQTRRKKQVSLRDYEKICRLFEIPPETFIQMRRTLALVREEDVIDIVISFCIYSIGCAFSRWDIRYATGARPIPELPDPFAPLPVCPPGMLQNAQGLPAAPEDVPADYPLRLTWGGILVDDEGHPEDVVGRVRDALAVIWGERAGEIEQEACDILGVKSLRDYFRAPGKFFAEHLKRYSKSRRQAPIYWPLGTPSGSYTLWLYYHRLSDQTLYTAVNDFVEPKLRQTEQQAAALRVRSSRDKTEEKTLETLAALEQELRGLRDELLRVAAFWKPNLNDGVVITAAPLWRLFQHKPWQKTLKETWQKLEKGDYDWAHLAYSIWPGRVVQAARKDRSIAIAHDLEDALWVKAVDGKGKETWVAREISEDELDKISRKSS